jgi:hypothetical protein
MNLALTAALPAPGHALRGGWRSGSPLLYGYDIDYDAAISSSKKLEIILIYQYQF